MTKEQAKAVLLWTANAIVETVNETPEGAPAGALYSAAMAAGMSHDTFEQIMAALVEAGKVRKRGFQYFPA